MSAHPNNSPEQKAEWRANRTLGERSSQFAKTIPSTHYNPKRKAPSRRDRHRADVARRRAR